jgi:hypothetical protein
VVDNSSPVIRPGGMRIYDMEEDDGVDDEEMEDGVDDEEMEEEYDSAMIVEL